MNRSGSTLTVRVPPGFDLSRAVCSYGYFLLAPNQWDPVGQRLHRPLRGKDGRVINTRIDQPSDEKVRIRCNTPVGRGDAVLVRQQVSRMLRLNEDLSRWHKLHREARRARFDRLFRSPTLFEDIVKTITGCNVTWPNTMRMNQLLCQHVGFGAFPTPEQLAKIRTDTLKRRCKVGYRAERIVQLARRVVRSQLDLEEFEDVTKTTDEIYDVLLEIHGIGPYAAANLCQLLGRYDRLAIDTETYRHFRQVHGLDHSGNPKSLHPRIEAHYARYAPYQFLAYWFELWGAYQDRYGNAHQWTAHDPGPNFTAANLK